MTRYDPTPDQIEAHAYDLARTTSDLCVALRDQARTAGLTRDDLSARGLTQDCIEAVEHYDGNPTLSTLRHYALAVGARITITVTQEETP